MTSRSRQPRPSGRFLLRVDPGLHASLKASALELGISLNDYCTRTLSCPVDESTLTGDGPMVVRRAMGLYGPSLLGVVVFGSWSRGEAGDTSDVDVLVVLDRSVPLTRALYRSWDAEPIVWDSRPVEIHLVHLPAADDPPTGIWGEVALDGIVLFERSRRVSACLGRVRRAIAAGQLVRRVAQGQPYWTRVA